jgi:hypothetical protein
LQVTLDEDVKLNVNVLLPFRLDAQNSTWRGGGAVTGLFTVTVVLALPEQEPVVPVTV